MASSERTEAANAAAAPPPPPPPRLHPLRRLGAIRSAENWGGQPSGAEAAEATLKDGLRCDLLMNARYHSSREAFLDTLHRVLMFLIIVLGAAAVSDLLSTHIQWIREVLQLAPSYSLRGFNCGPVKPRSVPRAHEASVF